jgi:hypothetical protein
MIVQLFTPDFEDDNGPFGPLIRKYIAPEVEPFDEEAERDAGDFDQDEYGPAEYKQAA